MKKVFGLCILAILFLVAAGCTQSAPSTQMTTTVPTTIVAQETTAAMVTVMPTENATPATTVDVNATMGMANATAPSSETAVETSVPQTPLPAQTPLVTAIVIHIQNNTFNPAVTTVLPGTSITWVNDDTISHSVKTTGVNAGMFNSGDIAPGSAWDYTFGTEGTFGYTEPKILVNGTIIVQKAKTLSDYTQAPVPTTT